jgi:hypothetical protein
MFALSFGLPAQAFIVFFIANVRRISRETKPDEGLRLEVRQGVKEGELPDSEKITTFVSLLWNLLRMWI